MSHNQNSQNGIARSIANAAAWLRYAAVVGALAGSMSCSDMLVGKSPERTQLAMYDQVWSDFDRYYSFFAISGVDWNNANAHYRPLAQAAENDSRLIQVLRAMLSELRDPHVDLAINSNTVYTTVNTQAVPTFYTSSFIYPQYVSDERFAASSRIDYGKIGSDLCYMHIPSFGGEGWTNEIDTILSWCSSVRGVIVDVRDNPGGTSDNAEAVAGRFVTAKKVFAYVRYRNGPGHSDFDDFRAAEVEPAGSRRFTGGVAVLVNRRSLSASEHFALAMRGRAALVGDTTAGGMGNPLLRELPNGWMYRVPQWIEYDENRITYERKGIPPTIYARYDVASFNARRDPQIEAAIAHLRK